MSGSSLRWLLWGGALATMLVAACLGYFLHLKGVAGRTAQVLAVDWNPDRTCSVTTYTPALGERSIRSRLFRLFTAPTFFRVHDQEGDLLRSSEWRLWEREAGELEPPQWIGNGRVLYPTTRGYAQWELPECVRK
ncbi:hypothetical protein [Archangium sp.]|uniref:hypothetical protein n=1 Tax=Archangium sp. TaxID=1872627 RepID=UPI00286A388B|nr:hypothetical protein [Archangium sp.]